MKKIYSICLIFFAFLFIGCSVNDKPVKNSHGVKHNLENKTILSKSKSDTNDRKDD